MKCKKFCKVEGFGKISSGNKVADIPALFWKFALINAISCKLLFYFDFNRIGLDIKNRMAGPDYPLATPQEIR